MKNEKLKNDPNILEIIKLDANENPLGSSPKALIAAQNAITKINFYPDESYTLLRQALAKNLEVNSSQLIIGNGSENILEIITKSYLNTNSVAVIPQYAFATIPMLVSAMGAEKIILPLKNWHHDINATIQACNNKKIKLLFIVNPSNPIGTYTSEQQLIKLLDNIPSDIFVIVDEAYMEYVEQADFPDTIQLLERYKNLIITRTFSKMYGLAALRVGYAISSSDIIKNLNNYRVPYNCNSIGASAACAALLDHQHMNRTLACMKKGKKQLEEGFKKMNIDYIPSISSFITIDIKNDAILISQKLLKIGIMIRPLTDYQLSTYFRITIGTYEQNIRLLEALNAVMN